MIRSVMTIAGSDCSGGAGIQADIKTCSAIGVYSMSVITALTVQNTMGVRRVEDIPYDCVYEQIEACFDDFEVHAVKIGMLSSAGVIKAVDQALSKREVKNVIIDPVLMSSTGKALLTLDALDALKKLCRHAVLITPNKREAEVLSGVTIKSIDDAKKAAAVLKQYTSGSVLIKGVSLAKDLVYCGKEYTLLEGEQIQGKDPHGTGCTLSSSIASYLALGYSLDESIRKGKRFVTNAIKYSLAIGHGKGPTNPLYKLIKNS